MFWRKNKQSPDLTKLALSEFELDMERKERQLIDQCRDLFYQAFGLYPDKIEKLNYNHCLAYRQDYEFIINVNNWPELRWLCSTCGEEHTYMTNNLATLGYAISHKYMTCLEMDNE